MSEYTGKLIPAIHLRNHPKAQKKRPPRIGKWANPQLMQREDGRYQWYGQDENKILVPWGNSFSINVPKDTPQKVKRRNMEAALEIAKERVRRRDKFACQEPGCGDYTKDCHHILGRSPEVFADEHFLILLCRKHHDDFSKTPNAAKKYLRIVVAKYSGYKYAEKHRWYFEKEQTK